MQFIKPKFTSCHEFPSGVYKITFDDKWFYIGSTKNLKRRFVRWKAVFKNPHFFNSRKIKLLLPEINLVKVDILKICENYEFEEHKLIELNYKNPLLLNKILSFNLVYGKLGRFDLDGNLIQIHNDIYEAAKSINCIVSDIKNDLKGNRYSVKGFRFKRIDDNNNFIEHKVKERHPFARRLSDSQVREIKKLRKKGVLLRELAVKYGVSISVIFKAAVKYMAALICI